MQEEKKEPVGGCVGGVAGLIVLVFGSIGRVVLTFLVGSRIANETENRQVTSGGMICGTAVGITIGLFGDSDANVWFFPALLFGSVAGAFVGWFTLKILREPWS